MVADYVLARAIGPVVLRAGSARAIGPVDLRAGSARAIGPVDLRAGSARAIGPVDLRAGSARAIGPVDLRAGSAGAIGPVDLRAGSARAIGPVDLRVGSVRAATLQDFGADARVAEDLQQHRMRHSSVDDMCPRETPAFSASRQHSTFGIMPSPIAPIAIILRVRAASSDGNSLPFSSFTPSTSVSRISFSALSAPATAPAATSALIL
jgi:hypothetical protein